MSFPARNRVLMVASVLARGGCERQMLATVRGLLQRGYTIEIFTLDPAPSGDASFKAEFDALGVNSTSASEFGDMSVAPHGGNDPHGLAPFRPILWHLSVVQLGLALEQAIRRFGPAVIHCWGEPSSLIGGHVASALGVARIVLHLVSMPPHQIGLPWPELYRDAYRSLLAKANVRLLNDSEAGVRSLQQWLEVPPGTVGLAGHSFVPGSVRIRDSDDANECRRRFGIPSGAAAIGAIMRFSAEKDPDLWLETAAIVAAARPDAYFVLAGHGPLSDRIAERVKEMGLSRRFILPGSVADIGAIYACLDVFLMTSRFEGTSNTLTEAQAAGVPVVAPDVGGIGRTIIDGLTGLLTATRAAPQLADAVLRILGDPDWPQRAAKYGPRLVSERFNWQRNTDKTVELYETEPPRIRHPARGLTGDPQTARRNSDRCVPALDTKPFARSRPQSRFGLLAYDNSLNLGDEIQSIAARQFLPAVDYYIDRESLNGFSPAPDEEVRLILNGWFCHRPERWPPPPSIRPLLISFHVSQTPGMWSGLRPVDVFAQDAVRQYLKEHGPVGARDFSTLEFLQDLGVESYFSGCLTLTLQRPDVPRDDNLLVLNDVPDDVARIIRSITTKRVVETFHYDFERYSVEARFQRARQLLDIYASAGCVVTTRLHGAMPCLAFETPVLLIDADPDQRRFSGLSDLVHHCTVEAFCSQKAGYDVNEPPPNPKSYLLHRAQLSARTKEFCQAGENNRRLAEGNGAIPTPIRSEPAASAAVGAAEEIPYRVAEEHSALVAQLRLREAEIDAYREAAAAQMEHARQHWRAERSAAAARIGELEKSIAANRQAAEIRIRELEAELDAYRQAAAAQLQDAQQQSRARRDAAAARIGELETSLQAHRKAAEARIRELEADLDGYRQAVAVQMQETQQQSQAERDAAAARVGQLEQRLEANGLAADARIRELEAELDAYRQAARAQMQDAQQQSQAERDAAAARVGELETSLQAHRQAAETRIRELEAELDDHRQAAAAQTERANEQPQGTVRSTLRRVARSALRAAYRS